MAPAFAGSGSIPPYTADQVASRQVQALSASPAAAHGPVDHVGGAMVENAVGLLDPYSRGRVDGPSGIRSQTTEGRIAVTDRLPERDLPKAEMTIPCRSADLSVLRFLRV